MGLATNESSRVAAGLAAFLIGITVSHGAAAQTALSEPPEPTGMPALPADVGPAPAAAPVPSAAVPLPPPPAGADQKVLVVLKDGQQLRGTLLGWTDTSLMLLLPMGSSLTLPRDSVASVLPDMGGPPRAPVVRSPRPRTTHLRAELPRDQWRAPNRTRYLYAPSAMMLKEGEGYFSQKMLIFSSVAVGVSDNFSVLAGSAVPFLFAGSEGANLVAAAKAGLELSDSFWMSAGVEGFFIPSFGGSCDDVFEPAPSVTDPDDPSRTKPSAAVNDCDDGSFGGGGAFGFAFMNATVGDPMAHATLAVGIPWSFSGAIDMSFPLVTVLAANLRLGQGFALVSENWFIPIEPDCQPGDSCGSGPAIIGGLLARFIGPHSSWDIGMLTVSSPEGDTFPIPWFDYTYHWDPRPKARPAQPPAARMTPPPLDLLRTNRGHGVGLVGR